MSKYKILKLEQNIKQETSILDTSILLTLTFKIKAIIESTRKLAISLQQFPSIFRST